MRIRTAGVVTALRPGARRSPAAAATSNDRPATESTKAAPAASSSSGPTTSAPPPSSRSPRSSARRTASPSRSRPISKDLQTNFVTASQQGSGPDVVVGAHDWIGNLVQNGAIDPVQLAGRAEGRRSPRSRSRPSPSTASSTACPYAIENLALIRNTDLAPDGARDHRGPGRRRQEAQDAERRPARSSACRSARTATPTTSTRSTPPAGGYLFGTDRQRRLRPRRTWASASPSRSRRSRRSPTLGEKGDGALKRSITGENSIATFTGGSARSWSPARGPSPTSRRPASSTTSRRSRLRRRQAGPAVRRRPGVLRRRQGQEQGPGPGVRHQLRHHARAGRGAVPGRAPPAGADRRVRPGQGHRPGPGQVLRRPARTASRAARRSRRWPRSGTRSARPRPPIIGGADPAKTITAAGKTISGSDQVMSTSLSGSELHAAPGRAAAPGSGHVPYRAQRADHHDRPGRQGRPARPGRRRSRSGRPSR